MYSQILAKVEAAGAALIAVSKTHPPPSVLALYEQGQRAFGENRVQEMLEKQEALPKDIDWHLIGHLQTNKVKFIAPFVRMIHSVDSLKLLQEIDKQATKNSRVIDCLLQFYIAQEETKFGLDLDEACALLDNAEYQNLQHVRICGVMGMASFSDDMSLVRREFQTLKAIFDALRKHYFAQAPYFREISMGMSGDWELALEEGSTMLRIGTLLFGVR